MFEEFKAHLENLGTSQHTIRGYLTDLNTAKKVGIINSDLSTLNLDKLVSLDKSPSTKHRMRASIRKYARYLVKAGTINQIPVEIEALDLPKVTHKIPAITSPTTIIDILPKVLDKEVKAMLYIFATTGCRISSLAGLKVEDIQGDTVIFKIAKGEKPYASILTKETKVAIEEHLAGRMAGYIFSQKNGEKSSPEALRNKLKARLGNDYFNPHSIRHGFATTLIENGANLLAVKEALNHSNVGTTQNYIHMTSAHLQRELKDKHPMFKTS